MAGTDSLGAPCSAASSTAAAVVAPPATAPTQGASPASILAIFIIQGALVGTLGTLLGVVGGLALAVNIETVVPFVERLLGVQFLDKTVYYISELPSQVQQGDVVLVAAIAFGLTLLATLYPSWRASKINPAEALRYE